MTDVRDRLRQAAGLMTPPELAFERMLERRDRKRRTKRVASRVFALVLAIAVVGGTLATLSGLAPDPVQPAAGGDTRHAETRTEVSRLQACIEEAGYDWEEVHPIWDSPEHPPPDSEFADPEFWEAWEVCVVETGLVEPFSDERIAAENRETMQYMRCMRQRGWELPDPEPWEGPYHPGLLDPPIDSVPADPERANRYYRDSTKCGFPFFDENDNVLPHGG